MQFMNIHMLTSFRFCRIGAMPALFRIIRDPHEHMRYNNTDENEGDVDACVHIFNVLYYVASCFDIVYCRRSLTALLLSAFVPASLIFVMIR